ncbi:hypothetical protein BHE74_00007076 [Ensete ventricosum]|nr:hypothetical protein BHE74_00007076 [Ensete ventricosum]
MTLKPPAGGEHSKHRPLLIGQAEEEEEEDGEESLIMPSISSCFGSLEQITGGMQTGAAIDDELYKGSR